MHPVVRVFERLGCVLRRVAAHRTQGVQAMAAFMLGKIPARATEYPENAKTRPLNHAAWRGKPCSRVNRTIPQAAQSQWRTITQPWA